MLILIDFLVQTLYTTADKISLKYLGSVSYLDLRLAAGQIRQKKVLNFVTQAAKEIDLIILHFFISGYFASNIINLTQSM